MRTACAKKRRSARCVGACRCAFLKAVHACLRQFDAKSLADHVGAVLTLDGEQFFASVDRNAGRADLLLQERVAFFNHVELVDFACEGCDFCERQWIDNAQFEDTGIRQRFLDVLVADATGDDADFRIVQFFFIERIAFDRRSEFIRTERHADHDVAGIFRDLRQTLLLLHMIDSRHGRHSHVLAEVLLIRNDLVLLALSFLHDPSRMGDPRVRTHEDDGVVLLAHIEGQLHVVLAFRRVGRFQQRNAGSPSVVSGILFVLAGVTSVVVSYQHDQSAGHAVVRCREKRIRCHVQSHVFHAGKGPCAADGCAYGHLDADLLVRRPFHVDLVTAFRQRLGHLCTRRPRVRADHPDTRFPGASGERLIA